MINNESTHIGDDQFFRCEAGNGSLNVGYDRFFRLCTDLLWGLGTTVHLRETSLREAWEKLNPDAHDLCPLKAEYLENCRKYAIVNQYLHCAAHAQLIIGAMEDATPYYCEVAYAPAAAITGESPV